MPAFGNVYFTYANDRAPRRRRRPVNSNVRHLLPVKVDRSEISSFTFARRSLPRLAGASEQQKSARFRRFFNKLFVLPVRHALYTNSKSGVRRVSAPVGVFDKLLRIKKGARRTELLPICFTKFARQLKVWSKVNEETVVRIALPHSLMDRYAFGYEILQISLAI